MKIFLFITTLFLISACSGDKYGNYCPYASACNAPYVQNPYIDNPVMFRR